MCLSASHPGGTRRCLVGQGKETLLATYRALIRSLMRYAGLTWLNNSSSCVVGRWQQLKNANLRIATGSLQITSISHLHRQCAMLSVYDTLSLTCKQYLAGLAGPKTSYALHRLLLLGSSPHTGNTTVSVQVVCQIPAD